MRGTGRRGGRRGRSRGGLLGEDGTPGRRRLSSSDLQLVLLAMLAEQPAHGYELIGTLEERSGGFYSPSPGMIYPALTYFEELGYAIVNSEGNRKQYVLTDAGRAHLASNRDDAAAILESLARIGSRMAEVREAFAGLDAADPLAADELHKARHTLRHALNSKRGCAPEEARRITGILERATAEILARPGH